jgi:hypothetical protein
MYAIKGVFDGKKVMATDPIPVQNKCDVVITFLIHEKEIQNITPENFTVKERMSALESLVGIIHSENPIFAEELAKEERLARQ